MRGDAIVATGRSDYPNQANNVLGFPYVFAAPWTCRARRVNHEMKIAAARALAELAREDVPDEVAAAYHGRRLKFGPDYIIPSPFDPRLIWYVPPFVAQAAMDTGVARKPIEDMDAYRESLARRLDPSAALPAEDIQRRPGPRQAHRLRRGRGDGGDPRRLRLSAPGPGQVDPVRPAELVLQNMRAAGIDTDEAGLEIINARLSRAQPGLCRSALRPGEASGHAAP